MYLTVKKKTKMRLARASNIEQSTQKAKSCFIYGTHFYKIKIHIPIVFVNQLVTKFSFLILSLSLLIKLFMAPSSLKNKVTNRIK